MSRRSNLSAAELARRIEQHLPVFARPLVDDLIAAVQRETHRAANYAPPATTTNPRRHEAETPD